MKRVLLCLLLPSCSLLVSALTPRAKVISLPGANGGVPQLVLADVDGDLALDLLVSNGSGLLLRGDGDGAFGEPEFLATAASGVAAADLNHDGRTDVVFANNSLALVLLAPTFSPRSVGFAGGGFASSIAIGDVNNDTHPDLALGDNLGNTNLFLGDGVGGFSASSTIFAGTFGSIFNTALGDVNGDGALDLLTSGGSSTIDLLLGHDDGTFDAPVELSNPFGPGSGGSGVSGGGISVVDLNNDQRMDVVGAGVFLGDNSGGFTALPLPAPEGALDFGTFSLIADDLDGDGSIDLAYPGDPFSFAEIFAFDGNGDGTFGDERRYLTGAEITFTVTSGDINNDGSVDLLTGNLDSISILLSLR